MTNRISIKEILIYAALAGACVWLSAKTFAAGDGRVDRYSDGVRVGSAGTKLTQASAGWVYVASGETTGSATVQGLDVGDVVVATPAESLGSATKYSAAATTNTVTVTLDQDAGTTVSFGFTAISPNYTSANHGIR